MLAFLISLISGFYFRKDFCEEAFHVIFLLKHFKKLFIHFFKNFFIREIPQELVQEAEGGKINLNMERHQDMDYVLPKRKMTAFMGQGHMLGRCV